MNRYWKHIDVPSDELEYVKTEVYRRIPDNNNFFTRLDLPITTFLGLPVKYWGLIQSMPNALGTIHSDRAPGIVETSICAINIGLENIEHSWTTLYRSDQEPECRYLPNGYPYYYYKPELCTIIDRFQLTKPVVWDPYMIHKLENRSSKIRRAITVRFQVPPWNLMEYHV